MVVPDVDTFVSEIYPGIRSTPPPPPRYFLDRIVLAPRNNDVDDMKKLLGMMSGEEEVFNSADIVVQEAETDDETADVNTFPIEFLRSLTASGLPRVNYDWNPVAR